MAKKLAMYVDSAETCGRRTQAWSDYGTSWKGLEKGTDKLFPPLPWNPASRRKLMESETLHYILCRLAPDGKQMWPGCICPSRHFWISDNMVSKQEKYVDWLEGLGQLVAEKEDRWALVINVGWVFWLTLYKYVANQTAALTCLKLRNKSQPEAYWANSHGITRFFDGAHLLALERDLCQNNL